MAEISNENNVRSSKGISKQCLNNENISINDNKVDCKYYVLNPLLNESLNNLVKRFERTKIPKPPPTKGHSIRKKSKLCNSLPNIFLPSSFDDTVKLYNNEKKSRWTNKLNLDLEKLKSCLRDNYDSWCMQKKRSISIPLLTQASNDLIFSSNQLDLYSNSSVDNDLTITFSQCAEGSKNDLSDDCPPILKIDSSLSTDEIICGKAKSVSSEKHKEKSSESTDKPFSYLDGAIIEPISPATPNESMSNERRSSLEKESKELKPCRNENGSINESTIESQVEIANRSKKPRRGRKKKATASKKPRGRSKIAIIASDETKSPELSAEIINDDIDMSEKNVEMPDISNDREKSLSENPDENGDDEEKNPEDKLEAPTISEPNTAVISGESTYMEEHTDTKKNVEDGDNSEDKNSGNPLEISDTIHSIPNPASNAANSDRKEAEIISKFDEDDDANKSFSNQSNDLEILSNSITNSSVVDTSMLPPRKRYKRFMYLESAKQGSPKDLIITASSGGETALKSETKDNFTLESDLSERDVQQPKSSNVKSRLKRKKQISDPKKASIAHVSINVQQTIQDSNYNSANDNLAKENIILPEVCDALSLPKRSVKRSKRDQIQPNNNISKEKTATSVDVSKSENLPTKPLKRSSREIIPSGDVTSNENISKEVLLSSEMPESLNLPTKPTTKPTTKRSRREIIPNEEISNENVEKDNAVPTELPTESLNLPAKSLTRSKREAAARGFATMVAMSLNNNQTQESVAASELKTIPKEKKVTSVKSESTSESPSTTPASSSRSLRKSSTNQEIPTATTKSKCGKRSKSPEIAASETGSEVKIKEPEKPVSKRQRGSKISKEKQIFEENPPSPGDTVASSESASHETIVKFRKIRTNTYFDQKPLYWFQEIEKCFCRPSKFRHLYEDPLTSDSIKLLESKNSSKSSSKCNSGIVWDCGDNCLNRLTYTECQPKSCPCGDACENQKIRKSSWASSLILKECVGKGQGVVTTKAIKEGMFVIEYVGEVVTESTFHDRMMNIYKEDAHHYCLHLDGDMLIDAYRCGSLARFINHSCNPNCEMQKWMVNGAYRMCVFATQDIPPDTELTYDYNFCSYNTENTQACLCGSSNCRGFIGSRPQAEQSESQRDRKKLLYIFGRMLSSREKQFIMRHCIFLLRNRESGRCRRLGIRRTHLSHGNRLPSTISEIKRRKAKKNQFLTQMSALNSIRSIRTRQLHNAQDNELITKAAQFGQVLRDLYNTLLEQKDPINVCHQLVAPFIKGLNRRKYSEFYRTVGFDSVASLDEVYNCLLEGKYSTMMAFDQDILQMLYNIELYAGKHSNIGKCAERIKPIYRELKVNSIALYEALTDEILDEKDKQKLTSNNLTQVSNAIAATKTSINQEIETSNDISNISTPKTKKRKQNITVGSANTRGRLERGAEVIKCICGFLVEAGHVMVQCDRCFIWQHAYCMNVARSAELADVTRMEPYYCHVCLNLPLKSLVREIPRNFIISDESVNSGGNNTLFWTLLLNPFSSNYSNNTVKIDDFVYIPKSDEVKVNYSKPKSPRSSGGLVDFSNRTIMRIYSLWKDSNGQRWMEGGVFLRPYDEEIKKLIEHNNNSGNKSQQQSGKRKSSTKPVDLHTHKWHQSELVYTDITKTLPVEATIAHCHVLNSYTFKQGRPISSPNSSAVSNDVYVCEWMINQNGEWSELDPTYLKINTKPYCFERFQDSFQQQQFIDNDKFSRQFSADDLLKIDQGLMSVNEMFLPRSNGLTSLTDMEKDLIKSQSFERLIKKLSDFAFERNRKLPLSSTPSSTSTSRGGSPHCENSGAKSPLLGEDELTVSHGRRKSLVPKKKVVCDLISRACEQIYNSTNKQTTEVIDDEMKNIYDELDHSPQLMIDVNEKVQKAPLVATLNSKPLDVYQIPDDKCDKISEQGQSVEEKISEKAVSTPKENLDDISNVGSEINFGDLVTLLKNKEEEDRVDQRIKSKTSKSTKVTKKSAPKKAANKKSPKKKIVEKECLDVAPEIVQDEISRPRTRSKRILNQSIDATTEPSRKKVVSVELEIIDLPIDKEFENDNENNEAESNVVSESIHLESELPKFITNEDDDNTKKCFVKLERMKPECDKIHKSTSGLSKKTESQLLGSDSTKEVNDDVKITISNEIDGNDNSESVVESTDLSASSIDNFNSVISKTDENYSQQEPLQNESDKLLSDKQTSNNPFSSSNRSKRKKGVPKRIPFDFGYSTINSNVKPAVPTVSTTSVEDDEEAVDLRATSKCSLSNLVDVSSKPAATTPEPITTTETSKLLTTIETSITKPVATNDFSSIENISSD